MRCWKLLQCLKLSNSGDILKLLVPSYNRKIICSGWRLKVLENTMMRIIRWSIVFNHSCKVISLKMIVIEIDHRGSKSRVTSNTFVKEQRADGSWQVKSNQALLSSRCLTCLRYALKGFERNLQIRIHSKQIITHRVYTSKAVQQFVHSDSQNTFNKLHPAFISGITDGEGSFIININKNNNLKFGWNVQLEFKITRRLYYSKVPESFVSVSLVKKKFKCSTNKPNPTQPMMSHRFLRWGEYF